MSRYVAAALLAVLVAFGSVAAAPQSSAPAATDCTDTGGPDRDVMAGTKGRDVLCSKKGPDYLHGAKGNDVLRAGKGNDTVVGNGGVDVLKGGDGKDRVFAVDGHGGDTVKGGDGTDQCFVDAGDHLSGCEDRFTGTTLDVVQELERVALDTFTILEDELPLPTEPPPAPPPATESFPPCEPPPANPPAPC